MSRMDMMAPSTTTPATSRTRLSSAVGAAVGAGGGFGEPWREGSVVVTAPGYGQMGPRGTGSAPSTPSARREPAHPNSDSITETTRGSSGTTVGANRATTEPDPSMR